MQTTLVITKKKWPIELQEQVYPVNVYCCDCVHAVWGQISRNFAFVNSVLLEYRMCHAILWLEAGPARMFLPSSPTQGRVFH